MPNANTRLHDLQAFIAMARQRSFTRAAAQLGVSQSALSHAMHGLEARLGVRLPVRATRSVANTEAGEHLLHTLAPRLDEIETKLAALRDMRERPSGSLRITCNTSMVEPLLWPRLQPILAKHTETRLEIFVDNPKIDIVKEQFDAGIRYDGHLAFADDGIAC